MPVFKPCLTITLLYHCIKRHSRLVHPRDFYKKSSKSPPLLSPTLKAFSQSSTQSLFKAHSENENSQPTASFIMMLLVQFLIAGLIAPFVLPSPTPIPGNTWGSGGGPPPGYYTVENFCSTPTVLYCCNGVGAAGAAGEPTATVTGCTYS